MIVDNQKQGGSVASFLQMYKPKPYVATNYGFKFPSKLILERDLTKTKEWILVSSFDYMLPDGRWGSCIKGDTTDKASIPSIVTSWLAHDDIRIIRAAMMHDDLYVKQKIEGKWIKRKEADKLLHLACLQYGMRPTMARAVYLAVRAGGGRMFEKRAVRIGNSLYGR